MDGTELSYGFYKNPLPRGLSYPVKRSRLDAALIESGVAEDVFHVRFNIPAGTPGGPMYVAYNRERSGLDGGGLVSVTVFAVPSDQRLVMMDAIDNSLPAMCEWIKSCRARPQTWRETEHHLWLDVIMGQAKLVEETRYWKP